MAGVTEMPAGAVRAVIKGSEQPDYPEQPQLPLVHGVKDLAMLFSVRCYQGVGLMLFIYLYFCKKFLSSGLNNI